MTYHTAGRSPGRLPAALRGCPCPGPSRRLLTHTPRRACPRSLRGPATLRACHAPCLPTAARVAPIATLRRPSPLALRRVPPGLSRRLLTHAARQSTPTYARRARSGGGACYAPGLSRAVLRKATARASPYADAVRRRIALNVSATVIGRRRFHLPRPLLVCRVPCADVRGSGSAPGDACPPCGDRSTARSATAGRRKALGRDGRRSRPRPAKCGRPLGGPVLVWRVPQSPKGRGRPAAWRASPDS